MERATLRNGPPEAKPPRWIAGNQAHPAAFHYTLLGDATAFRAAFIRNGGMTPGLAFIVLQSPAAVLGAAVFGPWSAITSSALASWWRKRPANDHTASSSPP